MPTPSLLCDSLTGGAGPPGSRHATLPQPCFLPRGMASPDRGALPLSGLTVLLVEDSRFAADAMRMMCQRSGARLRRAETMEQARAHLKTYRPDVVIVDLGLPDGRGDQLIREIAAARHGAVVLGMSGDPNGRSAALGAGAVGFVEKPLPGVAAFQRLVLRHLPERFVIIVEDVAGDAVRADPLAFQDDLAHAVDLMAVEPDGGQRRYLAGFVGGVARVAGDSALAEAARALDLEAAAMPRLRRLVTARLNEGQAF